MRAPPIPIYELHGVTHLDVNHPSYYPITHPYLSYTIIIIIILDDAVLYYAYMIYVVIVMMPNARPN